MSKTLFIGLTTLGISVLALNYQTYQIEHDLANVRKQILINKQSINQLTKQNNLLRKEIELKSIERVEQITKPIITYTPFHATAYSTRKNGDKYSGIWGSVTKLGTTPQEKRTIAVDKKVIPLGTQVEIIFPEPFSYMNGIYVAEDTGSPKKIYQNNIDIYFDSVSTCYEFGHKEVLIRIL